MSAQKVIKDLQQKLAKTVEHTLHEFSTLHTGKATPTMVETVKVQAYGSPTALRECASITIPEPRTIRIQPFDKGLLREIEKGIHEANLGLSPKVEGVAVFCRVPELTGERRKTLAKQAAGMAEEGRVRVRAMRHEALEALKKMEKEKAISEDEHKRFQKDVQTEHDKYIAEINTHLAKKEKELLTV